MKQLIYWKDFVAPARSLKRVFWWQFFLCRPQCSGSSMLEDEFFSRCWILVVQKLQKQRRKLLRTDQFRGFGPTPLHPEPHSHHPMSSPCQKVRGYLQGGWWIVSAVASCEFREQEPRCVQLSVSASETREALCWGLCVTTLTAHMKHDSHQDPASTALCPVSFRLSFPSHSLLTPGTSPSIYPFSPSALWPVTTSLMCLMHIFLSSMRIFLNVYWWCYLFILCLTFFHSAA